VLPCGSPDNAAALRNYITTYASHPNQFKYNGRSFASSFSGENCRFGQDSPANGWRSQFTEHPETNGQIHFVPSFFVDPATFGQYSGAINGAYNVSCHILFVADRVTSLMNGIAVEFRLAH
jgi:glucan endo-1,3-alpha-glucosidase